MKMVYMVFYDDWEGDIFVDVWDTEGAANERAAHLNTLWRKRVGDSPLALHGYFVKPAELNQPDAEEDKTYAS